MLSSPWSAVIEGAIGAARRIQLDNFVVLCVCVRRSRPNSVNTHEEGLSTTSGSSSGGSSNQLAVAVAIIGRRTTWIRRLRAAPLPSVMGSSRSVRGCAVVERRHYRRHIGSRLSSLIKQAARRSTTKPCASSGPMTTMKRHRGAPSTAVLVEIFLWTSPPSVDIQAWRRMARR